MAATTNLGASRHSAIAPLRNAWPMLQLIVLAATFSCAQTEAAIPDPLTEAAITTCEESLESSKKSRADCEAEISKGQLEVTGRIEGMKRHFADVNNQMNDLTPGIADLKNTLSEKYAKEAAVYGDLRNAASLAGAMFLHRQQKHSDPAQDSLMDRWMKCDDDLTAAVMQLRSCNTRAKTVKMWDTQREKQYKDKADVYILRVSRQADPVKAQITESNRVSATIGRMEQQVKALNSALPIQP